MVMVGGENTGQEWHFVLPVYASEKTACAARGHFWGIALTWRVYLVFATARIAALPLVGIDILNPDQREGHESCAGEHPAIRVTK